jgi:hypothetical protein
MEICPICTSELSEVKAECPTCGRHVGYPNVRAAKKQEEQEALEARYREAIEQSKTDDREQALASFDESMKKTCAVINTDLADLRQFIIKDKSLYSTYDLMVKGQTRKPATAEDGRKRKTIEFLLFGDYAEQIRYAALSLDGAGLKSYGPYALKLREVAIDDRASLLEDNSYVFVENHDIWPPKKIPLGYRATWGERHKLAVAKLSKQVSASTTEPEHPKILLSSAGARGTDEFIEVHIYGGFDNKAIEAVRGSSSAKSRADRADISKIKDYLKRAGQTWVEE